MKSKATSATFQPRARALALEPRILFDGVAAVAAAEQFSAPNDDGSPAEQTAERAADAWRAPATAEAPAAAAAPPAEILLVVDARVVDYRSLVANLPANVALLVVDPSQSGLTAIDGALESLNGLQSVQIISHGTPGKFTLGSDAVNADALQRHAGEVRAWGEHLSADGDILLYGCDIAQGAAGGAFIAQLAALTGADVAASADSTGAAAQGGNWTLEAATGAIETRLAIDAATLAAYGGTLASAATITDPLVGVVRAGTEDSPIAINGVTVADADNPAVMEASFVVSGGTLTLQGSGWTLQGGTTNNSASITIRGSVSQINAAIDGMQFTPDANQNSSITGYTPKVDISVKDVTNDEAAVNKTINLLITPVNDAPSIGAAAGAVAATVAEGGSIALSLQQLASDADHLDVDIQTGQQVLEQMMMTIVDMPLQGKLTYKGSIVLPGSVIPVSQIDQLTYTHDGTDIIPGTNDSVIFNVKISDGGGGETQGAITIDLTPVNKAPTVTAAPVLYEGQAKLVNPSIVLGDAYDNARPDENTYTITALDTGSQGTFFIDAMGTGNPLTPGNTLVTPGMSLTAAQLAQFKFLQNGAEPNGPGVTQPSYTLQVTDAGGGTGTPATVSQTINLTILPNNDDPVLAVNTGATINERNSLTIGDTQLKTTDADRNAADPLNQAWPTDRIVYTLEAKPQYGNLMFDVGGGNWKVLGVNGRFTQADIDAGRIRYDQTTNISVTTVENLQFKITDSSFGYQINPDNSLGPIVEGGVRDTAGGPLATKAFAITINPDPNFTDPGHAPLPGDAGYGADGETIAVTNINNTSTPNAPSTNQGIATWYEGNANSTTGVITTAMLHYEITRTSGATTLTVPPDQTIYTLVSVPANGTLQRQDDGGNWYTVSIGAQFSQDSINAGKIRFVHDGGEQFTSNFQFNLSDGSKTLIPGTFNIDVTPVNDRPQATGGRTEVWEKTTDSGVTQHDGIVYLTPSALGMSDADGAVEPAKRTGEGVVDALWFRLLGQPKDGASTARGHLERWDGSAWVTVTDADIAAGLWLSKDLLSATSGSGEASGLRYVHDGSEPLSYTGGAKVTFQYQVRDDLPAPVNPYDTNGTLPPAAPADASQGNVSTAGTTTIDIIPANNPPKVPDTATDSSVAGVVIPTVPGTIAGGGATSSVNKVLTVTEGTWSTIGNTLLQAIDQDNTTVQRQFILKATPFHGWLYLDGKLLGTDSTFTQADIDNGKLQYRHNGSDPGAATVDAAIGTYNDKFLFVVDDGVAQTSVKSFLIVVTPTNDAPTLAVPSGPINVVGGTGNTVAGFAISDIDLTDGVQSGETDFVQATVRLLNSAGTLVTDFSAGATGSLTFGYSAPGSPSALWKASGGTDGILQLQGTRAEVNAALAGLSLSFAKDLNANYKVQVIVDDRLRDATGALSGGANGGTLNQAATPGGAPSAVPSTVYDWSSAATALPADNDPNIVAKSIDIRVSKVNEPATLNTPASSTVNEDVRSKLPNTFVVSDPESNGLGTPITVTLSIPSGQGTLDLGGSGAQTSITPAGGQAVAIAGDGSNSVTLTGRAQDIQALLNGRNLGNTADDANGGLFYTSPADGNHDYNGSSSAGDVTLTVTLDESGSAIGTTPTSPNASAKNPNIVASVPITITPVNDAPTVAAGTGSLTVNGNTATAISDFVINDPDYYTGGNLPGTPSDGQQDFIQVTVRLNKADGSLLGNTADVTFSSSSAPANSVVVGSEFQKDGSHDGSNNALVIRGTRANVNQYLSGLQITLSGTLANSDSSYKVEVIADDRLRNIASGALDGSGKANGGFDADGSGGTTNVPTTAVDPYAAIPAGLTKNVASNTRNVFISSINDPGNVTVSNVTVNEGLSPDTATNGTTASLTLNSGNANIFITDPDQNGANNLSATITLSRGTITGLGTGNGTVAYNADNTTVTITGATLADLNNRLKGLKVTFPDGNANWNGSFDVTVVYHDQGNTGQRPGTLPAGGSDATTGNGLYDYDGAGNALKTTRIFSVTVDPVNDAPTGSGNVTLSAVNEDVTNPPGDTVSHLIGNTFSDVKDDQSAAGGSDARDTLYGIVIVGMSDETANKGKWQYYNGATWQDVPTNVSASSGLVVKAADSVRFVPNANWNGTPTGLTTRLIETGGATPATGDRVNVDSTHSGGATIYSDAANQVVIGTTVNAVNDAPSFSGSKSLTATDEDTASTPVSAATLANGLTYSDATDNQSANGGGNAATPLTAVAITGNAATAAQGEWWYTLDGGATWSKVPTGAGNTANAVVLDTGNAQHQVRFVPAPDYNGPVGALTLHAADGTWDSSQGVGRQDLSGRLGGSNPWSNTTASVDIAVTPVADITPDTLRTRHDRPISYNPITGSNGATADSFEGTAPQITAINGTAIGVGQTVAVANGTVTLGADNVLTFTPTTGFHGPTTFSYTVTSGGVTETANNTIIVNDPPVAGDRSFTMAEDSGSIGIDPPAANDPDQGAGAAPTVTAVAGVAMPPLGTTKDIPVTGGTVHVDAAGHLSFTPNQDFNGVVNIPYTVTDNQGDTGSATLTVTVTPVNDPPVNTVPGAKTTPEDTPLPIGGISVADVDGDTLTTTVSVAHGTLSVTSGGGATIAGDGTGSVTLSGTAAQINAALAGLTYTNTPDYNGADTLTVSTSDGTAPAVVNRVGITVTPVTDITNDSLRTPFNTPISYNPITGSNGATADSFEGAAPQITAINGAAIGVGQTVAVANGTVTLGAGNVLTFTPATDFHGSAAFTYTVTSGGVTETATDTILVNALPRADDDRGASPDGSPVTIPVLANDSDADNDTLTVTQIAGQPVTPGSTISIAQGTVTLNADGTLTFTPNPGVQGEVSFTYRIDDGHGGTADATVRIAVTPAPVNNAAPPPSPLPTTPSPGLMPPIGPPLGPYLGDQAREPSVYYEGDVFNRVPRLPIPFGPALFVHNAVAAAQAERAAADPMAQGHRADLMTADDITSRSVGSQLGFDPALFVQHAVRASQNEARRLEAALEMRPGVVGLGSDGRLPTPSLFAPAGAQPFVDARNAERQAERAERAARQEAGERPSSAAAAGDQAHSGRQNAPPSARAFSEQLQRARRDALPSRPQKPN